LRILADAVAAGAATTVAVNVAEIAWVAACFYACAGIGVEDLPFRTLRDALAATANLGTGVAAAAAVERVKVRADAGSFAAVAFATIQLRRTLRAG
jgi:hypothetical protein